jgi:hypothetical protein
MHELSGRPEAGRSDGLAHVHSQLWYCWLRRRCVLKSYIIEEDYGSRYLSRDYLGFSAVVDFVIVEVGEGVPRRRVSRHVGRDVTASFV